MKIYLVPTVPAILGCALQQVPEPALRSAAADVGAVGPGPPVSVLAVQYHGLMVRNLLFNSSSLNI